MKGRIIPFESGLLKPYNCYYEVRNNGQVFRVISDTEKVIAEEPTGTDKKEAMFAMTFFEGVKQYKLEANESVKTTNNEGLDGDILIAQVHFVKLLDTIRTEEPSVTFTDAAGERSDVKVGEEPAKEEKASYDAYMAPKPSIFKQIFTKIKHLFVKRE
ncbi:hypothetical protein [Kurthia sp. Dielmo]|uniref:hypothetical protein n=1 Tax=Kurthia sp. Dielmo TaxID=1033738 RepID=UPI001122450D|nr:hypothetical protein [Kurthia sp. Dielmo]